jgi:hypothetical protein
MDIAPPDLDIVRLEKIGPLGAQVPDRKIHRSIVGLGQQSGNVPRDRNIHIGGRDPHIMASGHQCPSQANAVLTITVALAQGRSHSYLHQTMVKV